MSQPEDLHDEPRLRPAVNQVVTALHGKYGSNAVPLDAVNNFLAQLLPAIVILMPDISEDDFEAIRKRVLASIVVVAPSPPEGVTAATFQPWFDEAVSSGAVELKRWYNYKSFLAGQGFSPQVVEAMDVASHEIVELLGDPRREGVWKRRGLVIGDVQSGKTATYLGIINKAADVGFKLIILLAGGTESLRKQTQFRVDQGLIGWDSSITKETKVIGVGQFKIDGTPVLAQSLTSFSHDFNKAAATAGTQMIDPNDPVPMIFVIKKNKTALENVVTWLKNQTHRNVPLLIVDDESDYASINTRYQQGSDSDPTLINKRIREVLALVPRSSYMAFTATPFANVFIDHETFDDALKDDLFPHDYIRALSSPSNYLGAEEYFGSTDAPEKSLLVFIEDAESHFPLKHKSGLIVDDMPDSLVSAIRTFVLSAAIREARGDVSARSMLVNVSRFKRVQEQVYDLVVKEFNRIKSAVELHSGSSSRGMDEHTELFALREVFESHYGDLELAWDQVRAKLISGVLNTSVRLVNSDRKFDPDLTTKHVISVGGNVLSRGLTLDGLTVSYFHRVVGAADTLMQMARWFGYRPGYSDLVRVWIDFEIAENFRYVADVVAELRSQLREMRNAGKTPRDFGLAVRKHPETLRITAANKQGSAEQTMRTISLAGRRIETTKLPSNPQVLRSNFKNTVEFLEKLDADLSPGNWNVPGMGHLGKLGVNRGAIAEFLDGFGFEKTDRLLGGSTLAETIRSSTLPDFNDWTVGLVNGSGEPVSLVAGLDSLKANKLSVRVAPSTDKPTYRISGKGARLAGSTDLGKTFEGGEGLLEILDPTSEKKSVYKHLPHPTLLIYFVEPNLRVNQSVAQEISEQTAQRLTQDALDLWSTARAGGVSHLVAIKVAIPGEPGSDGADVEYLVNGPWWEQLKDDEELAEADLEDIDE